MKKRENETACIKNLFSARRLRLMKLTFLFVLLACLQTSARTYSQDKITVNLQSADLKKALTVIERKSNYRFMYNEALIANKPKVDLNVKDADIITVLNKILKANGISYRILNNNLVVLKAGDDNNEGADIRVTGRVVGPTGEGLSGVSVTIKGTSTGTTTDAQGNFAITVPDENSVLVFSSIGYVPQEITVGTQTTVNITLQATASQMENIVVVGYGTQRKLDVTGSVSQVRGEEINKQPAPNPVSALQGKVAGVQITNSGAPGASPEIRIRGLGTVYGSATPLYVVDGVWFDDISFLNPADIENISILKDASSESIYGIRAANGVVLVTTKKGRGGKPSVNYNGYVGWQKVTNEVEMANANQYATLVNELAVINGGSAFLNPADFSTGTNWYGQIFRNALITNHQISVTGGTANTNNYNFSLSYLNQDGIVEKNNFQRYTARLQNDIQIATPLKVGYTITGAYIHSRDIPGGIFHELYAAAPIVPVFYADGSYGDPNDFSIGEAVGFNPQVTLDFFNQRSRTYRLNGSAFINLKFLRNFTFNTSIGGELGQGEVRHYLPVYTATLKQRNTTSRLTLSDANTRNWILENTLTYEKRFSDHNLRVLVGQSAQRYRFYRSVASAPNVPNNSEGDHYLRLGTAADVTVDDEGDLSTVASYFGRINYSFKNRYLINASLRADGSSKFPDDNRWGYFPSVGLGWVISEENFMANQEIFSNLKLRGSWGKIGNASVPSNISVLTVTQAPYLMSFIGGVPNTGASITTVVPPTTYWERGVGTDIGLEATILKGKLFIEADWYNRVTERAIFDIPIPGSVGTSSGTIIGNQADIQNRGFEFSATWRDNTKTLGYSVSANLGINNNKVLSVTTGGNPIFGGGQGITGGALATRTVVGQPIGQFYGLQVAGIFQNAAQVAASPQAASAKPGDFIYVDQNKDNVIDAKDRIPLGNPNPKYAYGINTNWNYKNFDLTLDFQGVAGVEVYNANLGFRFGNENFTRDFFENRWHGENTSNTYPSANIGGGNNYLPNSFFVEDGSYFRIRNIQLGYTLPEPVAQRIRARNVRAFINAQNAFNFFGYRGFSPEIFGGNPTGRGIDVGVYPLSATYNFGINLGF